MAEKDNNLEGFESPAQAAKSLGISVATLRKYSLLIEKVTDNRDYYQRTKQKARLYSKKNLEELHKLQELSKNDDLTLQEAAEQIFEVNGKTTKSEKSKNLPDNKVNTKTMVDAQEVIKLLMMVKETITGQNEAIQTLQKQVTRIEDQNQKLIAATKQLPQPEEKKSNKVASSQTVSSSQTANTTSAEKVSPKAAEEDALKSLAHVNRSLAQMQMKVKKKHWWEKLFK
ncbi:MerR family transcriptional regulator [Lactobacillus sp. PV037]|uniref:MerR family transcriptional regulator n=1 Tax=unclassified Lactobacillus TaxID=2620435 RepID=UPI00223EC1FA|nr:MULTISPECIES: MerR family transcriptional regulator [unclassified Lactobacillus]QNQ81714.1 MerR family transcriptional regulator [Lactobacillus sp. PV012]QNQ84241.1 MerR family transcriptional regulator [Lactobacillus sp. PV037]